MKYIVVVLLHLVLLALLHIQTVYVAATLLDIGFYNESCPSAEETVRSVVSKAYATNWDIAPGLIRMHFHDCFVRGCDASVLLDSTSGNSSEKEAPANLSLHGFEVIDTAKALLEAECPQTVSCADILAFAARDSATLTGNPYYQVPSGRRDGLVSIAAEVNPNIPSPYYNATQLIASFAAKNLTATDMVTLLGAHSIGVAHCNSFMKRLYNFSGSSNVDPALDPGYAEILRRKCPPNTTTDSSVVTPLDSITPKTLDNMYYVGLELNLGLLSSDQALLTEPTLKTKVDMYAYYENVWASRFGLAMVRMGEIEILTGSNGEIRTHCNSVNGAAVGSRFSS